MRYLSQLADSIIIAVKYCICIIGWDNQQVYF